MQENPAWPQPAGKGRGGQLRVLAAGLLVFGALAYLVWASLPQGTVYYQTVAELQRQASDPRPVRVAGIVAPGSTRKSAAAGLEFTIQDGLLAFTLLYFYWTCARRLAWRSVGD